MTALHSHTEVQMKFVRSQVDGRGPVDTLCGLEGEKYQKAGDGECSDFLNGEKSRIRKEAFNQITEWRWKLAAGSLSTSLLLDAMCWMSAGCLRKGRPTYISSVSVPALLGPSPLPWSLFSSLLGCCLLGDLSVVLCPSRALFPQPYPLTSALDFPPLPPHHLVHSVRGWATVMCFLHS